MNKARRTRITAIQDIMDNIVNDLSGIVSESVNLIIDAIHYLNDAKGE